jgi:hypothetical protein
LKYGDTRGAGESPSCPPPLPRDHQASVKETHHETSRARPASSRAWPDTIPCGVQESPKPPPPVSAGRRVVVPAPGAGGHRHRMGTG